ncbi:ribonuclease III [Campylobacter ureolyticus RIGS 9880]|uniref:Ribonuclease 3 n=1 Tax=Campylobacter ureolyticus RIGS 9880 TaxID=1032069 RepID=A0AAU8U1X9_9BACT|nr:ribonuclease III [Campylobacter ureolyticus]AKT91328.1 ribonuclease III [Campylobacter ureolyticus RIGS 9880]MCZ6172702.1 ribonuclease III [Campylobacter ureolyticus]
MLEELQKKLNYNFQDLDLLQRALTHKSSNKPYSNERLEYLGDAVMDLVVAKYLFEKFKNTPEGDLSKLRAALVNETSFAKLAKALNLGDFIIISSAEERNNGRNKNSLLSDAFEALMGAIFLEIGFEKTSKIALNLLEKEYHHISLEEIVKDYKTNLQEITQSILGLIPTYILLDSKGPDHKKEFKIGVFLGDEKYGEAIGKSKKDAEQKAAKIAIEILHKKGRA